MSKIKDGGLHQYGAEPFEQQQFGTAGDEGVKWRKPSHTRKLRQTHGLLIVHALLQKEKENDSVQFGDTL